MQVDNIVKFIRRIIYALVIVIPLIYFPTAIYPFEVVKVVVFQSLIEIIFILWLGLAIFYKEYRPRLTPIFWALTILFIIASLSAVFGVDWRTSLWSDESRTLGLVGLFHFFALFLVASSLREKINWKKLWALSFATTVLVSLIGISQRFIVIPKTSNVWMHILYSAIPQRIGSTFSNSAFMAGYLLFNFFIGLWLILHQASSVKRQVIRDFKFWFLGIGAVLIVIAIFLSQTLGAILGLIAGIFILFLYFLFAKNGLSRLFPGTKINLAKFRNLIIGLLILIIAFGAIFWITRSASFWQKIPGLGRISQASFESDSIRGRLIAWRISWEASKDRPWLGWGFENFRIAFNKHYDPKILTGTFAGSYWDKPHNVLLEYLTTTGFLGLLAYLGIFAAAFYTLFKKNISPAKPFIFALLMAYFVQNLFIFDTIGTYLMFFLVLAFIDYQGDKNPSEEQSSPAGNLRRRIVFTFLLLLGLIPVYYNYQIFEANRWEYWGVNYFLNRLPESSLVSFSRAIATPTPYHDDIRKNFANTVKQAYQQGIQYPHLDELQGNLVDYLKLVINRHPREFFNYINLAEFENVFYKYNPGYVKEADALAQKALELSPDRQQAYYVLAKSKLLEGDAQAAYNIFEKVISLNPSVGDPHFDFGLMAYTIGDAKKGAEEIAIAASLGRGPQSVQELIVLGNVVGDYDHDYKKAIGYYQRALYLQTNLNSKDKASLNNILLKLALAYYFDGQKYQSRQTFSQLKESVDLRKLGIYPDLRPILQELKIDY